MSTTIISRLQQAAKDHPDKLAFVFLEDGETESASLTFGQLARQAEALAVYLLDQGIQLGDNVALTYPPGLDFVVAFVACLWASIQAVPTNLPDSEQGRVRVTSIIEDCHPTAILSTSAVQHDLAAPFSQFKWITTDSIEREHPATGRDLPAITPDTIAFLQYTSGSTGTPRGVINTHRNVIVNILMMETNYDSVDQEMIQVSWLPHYHDMGLIVYITRSIVLGQTAYLMPPMAFLRDPIALLRLLSRLGESRLSMPPVGCVLCVRKTTPAEREGLDLSRVHTLSVGAEPVSPAIVEEFIETFSPYGFRPSSIVIAYGLAEVAVFASGTPARPKIISLDRTAFGEGKVVERESAGEDTIDLFSCGRMADGSTVRIVDPETSQLCAPDEIGEVWISGEHVASGYWQRTGETEATFQASIAGIDEGPFLRTGDMGFLRDEEVVLTGRLKELIIIHGRNIYPHDVEQTITDLDPLIHPRAIVAYPVTTSDGEELGMVVELKSDISDQAELSRLTSHIQETLAQQAALSPVEIFLLPPRSVMRTTSGKIRRQATADAVHVGDIVPLWSWQRSLPTSSVQDEQPLTEDERLMASLWKETLGVASVGLHDNFFALGGDSIQATRLTGQIARVFKRNLPPTALFQAQTIVDLLALLSRSAHEEWPSLVPLRDFGSNRPLFCIHPRGGHLLSYYKLVKALGDDQPVYGLQAAGLAGERPPMTSIPEMAAHYLQAIQAMRIDGPIDLCGFSLGGVIALEMASQMPDYNLEMGSLIMVDTMPPDPMADQSPDQSVRQRLGQLLRGQPKPPLHVSIKDRWSPEKKVLWSCRIAEAHYIPPAYSGDVIYIKASDQALQTAIDFWKGVVGGELRKFEVQGTHRTIIEGEGAQEVADIVLEILRGAS